MHNYRKRYIDEQGGYIIEQLRDDGTIRQVDEDHRDFVEWSKTNVLEEIAFKPVPQHELDDQAVRTRVDEKEGARILEIEKIAISELKAEGAISQDYPEP